MGKAAFLQKRFSELILGDRLYLYNPHQMKVDFYYVKFVESKGLPAGFLGITFFPTHDLYALFTQKPLLIKMSDLQKIIVRAADTQSMVSTHPPTFFATTESQVSEWHTRGMN